MKKIISFLLAIAMVFVLVACAGDDAIEPVTTPSPTPPEAASSPAPMPSMEPDITEPAPKPLYDPIADDVPVITAEEALAEIVIGANLCNIFTVDYSSGIGGYVTDPDSVFGYDNYYFKKAMVNIAFWNWNFDWIIWDGRNGDYFEASIAITEADDSTDGYFHIGVCEGSGATLPITIEFTDARVEMPDGTVYNIENINGIHVFSDYDEPDINGFAFSVLDVPGGIIADEKYHGGMFKATVNVIDAPAIPIERTESKEEYYITRENWDFDIQTRQQKVYQRIDDFYNAGFNYMRFMIDWTPHTNDESFPKVFCAICYPPS